MMKDAFRLRGEGADPKGQAIIAEDLAKLYAEEFDHRTAYMWVGIAIGCRVSIGLPSDRDLDELADTVAATVADGEELLPHACRRRHGQRTQPLAPVALKFQPLAPLPRSQNGFSAEDTDVRFARGDRLAAGVNRHQRAGLLVHGRHKW